MAAEKQLKIKGRHGGPRPNSGRKPGTKDRATPDQKAAISDLAKQHAPMALQQLVDIARNGNTDSARVAACNSILDRAYGKPSQSVMHGNPDGTPLAWPALTVTLVESDG